MRLALLVPGPFDAVSGGYTYDRRMVAGLRALGHGAEVVELDTRLDWTFPKYNPNPEDHGMLQDMAAAVREHGADLCFGFDGDGDRCGVVDNEGHEIFADTVGVMLARDISALHPNATFVADVRHRLAEASDDHLTQGEIP